MVEGAFQPYFNKTMEVLIQAGKMSLNPINQSIPVEEQKNFHDLRQSLVDAFMSIINGIKTPASETDLSNDDRKGTTDSISNMYYYLDGLISLEDLQISVEFARQILDLYCDIVLLQTSDNSNDFSRVLSSSSCHDMIQKKFAPFCSQIN